MFLQKMHRVPEYTGPDDCFWLHKEEEGVVQMLFLKKAKMFRGSMLQWGVWDIALLLVAYTISQCKNITGICWAPCLLIQQGKVLMSVFWSHLLNHHGPQSSEKFQFQIITNTFILYIKLIKIGTTYYEHFFFFIIVLAVGSGD